MDPGVFLEPRAQRLGSEWGSLAPGATVPKRMADQRDWVSGCQGHCFELIKGFPSWLCGNEVN